MISVLVTPKADALTPGQPYEVVVILCGGTYKIDDRYYPTTYEHGDEFGMLGGDMRVKATLELYKHKLTKTMLFSTGVSAKQIAKFGPEVPPEANTYAARFQELLAQQKQAHPEDFTDLSRPKIVLEDQSVNTADNIRLTLKIISRHGWHRAALLSSDYHIARAGALLNLVRDKDNVGHDISFDFLSAEKIVTELVPGQYNKEIEAAYQSKAAQLRLRNEANGLRDMREGRYVLSEFQLPQ